MKTLRENKFVISFLDESKKLIIKRWFSDSIYMTDNEIKEETSVAAKTIEQYQARYILADDRNRAFPYDVEIQNWVASTITTACIKAGVEKFAILTPTDIFAEVSTEQAVSEVVNIPFEIKFFTVENEAMQWFGF